LEGYVAPGDAEMDLQRYVQTTLCIPCQWVRDVPIVLDMMNVLYDYESREEDQMAMTVQTRDELHEEAVLVDLGMSIY
jgi:hypothetical protein